MTEGKTNNDPYLRALKCPVCGAGMEEDVTCGAGQLLCQGARKHVFDKARSGYVHLAPRHSGGGDARDAVRARTAFLSAGYYTVAAEALCELLRCHVDSGLVVDAGCGEGYYTNHMALVAGDRYDVCGFDLSRDAVDAAAKAARRQDIRIHYAVASVFELLLLDGTADAVVNIFAPCAEQEFCRVLRPGGALILLGAGERHLWGLKQTLYDDTYQNAKRADLPQRMRLIEQRTVRDEIEVVGNEQILNLFSMTPYYWRTSSDDRRKLEGLDTLKTEISFDCRVYVKE